MKRIFDITLLLLSLPLLLSLYLLVAWLVRSKLGSPILFKQVRPGKDANPFEMIKFRSMTDDRNYDGELLPDSARLNKFGQFLRSSSLDELPELWNVFKGEMSLVGPRPLLMEYVPLYSPEQARRHELRPGITGWAQVNGRNAISWEDKFKLDVWYVNNQSISLDFKILFLTIFKIFKKENIEHSIPEELARFKGIDQ